MDSSGGTTLESHDIVCCPCGFYIDATIFQAFWLYLGVLQGTRSYAYALGIDFQHDPLEAGELELFRSYNTAQCITNTCCAPRQYFL
jgi:hypothetical protein